jgi:[acyl-carrier-protein] S-malonyltransferase
MGKELAGQFIAAKAVFEEADSILGSSLSRLMWDGPESDLNDTVNTQPALYVHSVAALKVLEERYPGFRAGSLAGHSLGELTALTAAGALDFRQGLQLVRLRGELMKKAGEISPGGMAAILGLEIPELEKVCSEASSSTEIVQIANDNCPGQVVISGDRNAVERAISGAKAHGAKRAIPLAVSIAAHSPLMATIQAEWDAAVDSAKLTVPGLPVIGNVRADYLKTAADARRDIKSQMQSRVKWTESIQKLIAEGFSNFLEMGNGSVLIGLLKRISASEGILGLALGSPEDFTKLADHP